MGNQIRMNVNLLLRTRLKLVRVLSWLLSRGLENIMINYFLELFVCRKTTFYFLINISESFIHKVLCFFGGYKISFISYELTKFIVCNIHMFLMNINHLQLLYIKCMQIVSFAQIEFVSNYFQHFAHHGKNTIKELFQELFADISLTS